MGSIAEMGTTKEGAGRHLMGKGDKQNETDRYML